MIAKSAVAPYAVDMHKGDALVGSSLVGGVHTTQHKYVYCSCLYNIGCIVCTWVCHQTLLPKFACIYEHRNVR